VIESTVSPSPPDSRSVGSLVRTGWLLSVGAATVIGGAIGYGSIYINWIVSAPRLDLSSSHLDLGVLAPNQTATRTVTLRNGGRRGLRIEAVKASCGCTTAELETSELAPGEQTDLTITPSQVDNGSELVSVCERQNRKSEADCDRNGRC